MADDMNDIQNSDPNQQSMMPETAQFLDSLSGIGTGAFLDMTQADTPQFRDWRDANFTADNSGSYVSQKGQPYTNSELKQIHGVLSEQAGNPLVSRLFAGPKSPLADYMTWRNQNYYNDTGGGREDEDGNLYTEPALQQMFAAKSNAQPGGASPADDDSSQASDEMPIVDISSQVRDPSKIPKQSSTASVPPPKTPLNKIQQQQTLDGLVAGINNPAAATPMGLTPDGHLMLDISPQLNMRSKIFPPKEKGYVYGDQVSPEFLTKVKQISGRLGIDPNWLMTAMHFETRGTFGAGEKNAAGSGATGLIQFMPSVAKGLGTTTEDLAKMKPEDQLDYVEKYLQPHSGDMHSLSDVYMAILHPADMKRSDDYVLFQSPSRAYDQNKGAFDATGKGYVTKGDVDAALDKHYQQAVARGTTILKPDGSSQSRLGNKTIVQLPNPPNKIPKLPPPEEPIVPPKY